MLPRLGVVCAVLLACAGRGGSFDVDTVIHVLRVGWDIVGEVTSLWTEVKRENGTVEFPLFRGKGRHVAERILGLSRDISALENSVHDWGRWTIESLLRDLPTAVRLELRLDDLLRAMSRVDSAAQQLEMYVERGYDNATDGWLLERHTMEDMAQWIVSHDSSSVRNLLQRIHDMVAPSRGSSWNRELLGLLRDSVQQEGGGNVCSLKQSPQQLLYSLYTSVALTELKGYAMMQFSWMLLKLYDKGNFTLESELMRDLYTKRANQKMVAVKSAMAPASRQLWRCDPKKHVLGETYVQLTQLLQGHIQNEVDMNSQSTCRENCEYYSYAKSHGCYKNQFCAQQQRCNGKLLDCKYIDSDMWVCLADKMGERRYDWVEYENGRVLGRKGKCSRGTTKVDSWWRWVFWHCSYCFCMCDEQGPKSDRYFNLRPVKANVARNMVVTGLRFTKVNRVIHLQIQEGALLPRGGINASSLRWRPVDDYSISDSGVFNGQDYHTLSWEQRAIDLDDLVARPGQVLTGVKFRRLGTHLNLEIMVTPLNFTQGKLIKPLEQSVWMGNDNTDASWEGPRKRLPLKDPDVPTRAATGSRPDSASDQFLLFTHSDISSDAAQTTVPFLDAQPVAPEPPTMLSGAGIHHKGRPGYGGFVAPKVVTYDYSPHITVPQQGEDREARSTRAPEPNLPSHVV